MKSFGLKNTGTTGIDRMVFSIPDSFFSDPYDLVRQFQQISRKDILRNTINSIQGKFGYIIVGLNLDHYRAHGESVPMAMLRLQENLKDQFGEIFHFQHAKIAAVEIHCDALMNSSYSDYRPILSSIRLPGMRRRWFVGSTFYAGSKTFMLKIYDKGIETHQTKYKNLMRMEFTITRRSHRLNSFGIKTVHDLLKNFYSFETALFSQLQANFQRLTRRPIRNILPGESLRSMTSELLLRNKIHADEATAWVVADSRGKLKWEEIEENIREAYSGKKNMLYRNLARARGIFESIQLLRPTARLIDHTILCSELEEKFRPKAVRAYDLENPYDLEEVYLKTRQKAYYAA